MQRYKIQKSLLKRSGDSEIFEVNTLDLYENSA